MLLERAVRETRARQMTERRGHPAEIREDMKAAVRLEWWNIGWTISIIVAMGVAMGSSQAMRTAWIEDTLGLVPPIVFLVAERFEARAPNRRFHYGYDRVNGLGFMIAAVALAAVGLFLLKDAVDRAGQRTSTSRSDRCGCSGRDIWLGWFMLAAQAYATIPPLIIGRKELPLAEAAARQADPHRRADEQGQLADRRRRDSSGVAGLGFGWWWADSAAAVADFGEHHLGWLESAQDRHRRTGRRRAARTGRRRAVERGEGRRHGAEEAIPQGAHPAARDRALHPRRSRRRQPAQGISTPAELDIAGARATAGGSTASRSGPDGASPAAAAKRVKFGPASGASVLCAKKMV